MPGIVGNTGDFSRWGLFAGVPHLGFGVIRQKVGGFSVSDYQLSVSLGSRTFSWGLGYGWSGGDVSFFGRRNLFKLGFLLRPNRYVSFGTTGSQSTGRNDKDVAFELAARPILNRVLFSIGRDINIDPEADIEPLNYFIYPYVLVDGMLHDDVERHVRWEDVKR